MEFRDTNKDLKGKYYFILINMTTEIKLTLKLNSKFKRKTKKFYLLVDLVINLIYFSSLRLNLASLIILVYRILKCFVHHLSSDGTNNVKQVYAEIPHCRAHIVHIVPLPLETYMIQEFFFIFHVS